MFWFQMQKKELTTMVLDLDIFYQILCSYYFLLYSRSVNDKQRTFALSIQQMCMRFIGMWLLLSMGNMCRLHINKGDPEIKLATSLALHFLPC